ncbi:MAG TPA: hypothetical protein VJ994_07475 [Paracoccaceae bacterium]|nr:hypothetical protein [Paracoccaceae bacterium]
MTRRRPLARTAAPALALALAGCGADVVHQEDFESYGRGVAPNGPSPGPPRGDENRTASEYGIGPFGTGQGLTLARVGPDPDILTYAAVPVPGKIGDASGYGYVFAAEAFVLGPDPMLAEVRKTPVPNPAIGAVLAEVRLENGDVRALDGENPKILDVAYATGDVLEVSIDLDVDAGTYDVAVINTDHRPTDPKDRSDALAGLALGAPLGPADDRPYLQLTFADEGGGRSPAVFRIDDVRITER